MYLFTRRTRLSAGHLRDGMDWAVATTEKVNQITSLDVGLWVTMFSPGAGSLSWGATAESLEELEDAQAKLAADDIFVDMTARAAHLTNGMLDDQVAQFIYQPGDLIRVPRYVAVIESALANGSFRSGIEAGIAIAQKATDLGGLPTSFLVAATGSYGGVAWITSGDSLAHLEASEQSVNMDPRFLALVDEHSTCYLPGVTTQSIWQRIV